MNRKKVMAFLLTGVLMFSANNVIAAEKNTDASLDVEKVAMAAIKTSPLVISYEKRREDVKRQYVAVQNGASMARLRGISIIQLAIINPIEAEYQMKAFDISQEVNTNTVQVGAYSKYISLLKANYGANIQRELKESLGKDYEKTLQMLKLGLVSKNDARLVEINYLKSVHQLDSIEKSLNSAYMAVNFAMGEDITKNYDKLIDNSIEPDMKIKPLNEYVQAALVNRGEIVNGVNSLDAKKKEYEYINASLYPDYKFYAQQTEYDIDSAQDTLDEAKINVQLEINNGYKVLQGNIKAVESQQANYNLAESNYKAAKIQYDNSMITLKQFEDAKIAKAAAQINLKNAQFDAWLQQVKMETASGVGPAIQ